jgi:hypothetical protein
MRSVLGTILGRYDEIIAGLGNDPVVLDPIFWEGPDGEIIASDWVAGLLDESPSARRHGSRSSRIIGQAYDIADSTAQR